MRAPSQDRIYTKRKEQRNWRKKTKRYLQHSNINMILHGISWCFVVISYTFFTPLLWHLTVEPESVAGTTAPARAETSQLGGPALSALQFGLFWMVKVPYDNPIQRKNASSMCHLQVALWYIPFIIHQKDTPKNILHFLEWCQPQPPQNMENKNTSIIPISLQRGSSER